MRGRHRRRRRVGRVRGAGRPVVPARDDRHRASRCATTCCRECSPASASTTSAAARRRAPRWNARCSTRELARRAACRWPRTSARRATPSRPASRSAWSTTTPSSRDSSGTTSPQGYRRIKCKIEPGRDDVDHRARACAIARTRRRDRGRRERRATASTTLELSSRARRVRPAVHRTTVRRRRARRPRGTRGPLAHASCLDESITSRDDRRDAIARGACAIVSVKPGRVGGLRVRARRARRVRRTPACPRSPGGMLETGIGRAALLALAALPGLHRDRRYARRRIAISGPTATSPRPFVARGRARSRVPDRTGTRRRDPMPEQLARCTVARERMRERTT